MYVVSTICILIVSVLLVISLRTIFYQPKEPGPVEKRLDLALEVELIADAIERFANDEQ